MSDNACIICGTEVDDHPTERNNPAPLASYNAGFACRSCDSFVTAARMFPLGEPQSTLMFLQTAFALQRAKRVADEMMQTEMTRLEAEETARNEAGCEHCGYIEDDLATHYEDCVHFDTDLIADDTEELIE